MTAGFVRCSIRPSFFPFPVVLGLIVLLASCGGGGGGGDGPRFTSAAPTVTVYAEDYVYAAQVVGFGGAPAFSLPLAPDGMTVDAMGVVRWVPTDSQIGVESVTLRATWEGIEREQSWQLRVHQDVLLGTAYSPRGHTGSSTLPDIEEYFSDQESFGRLIGFHSTWRDDVASAGSLPGLLRFATTAQATYGIGMSIGVGWSSGEGEPDLTSESEPGNNSWTNAETRDEYVGMLEDLAATYQPTHLFLGNEINSWYLSHTGDWPNWMSVLGEAYDAIKAVSSDTIVFTVFQIERLKGLGSARNGWNNPPHWDIVDDVAASGKIDAIGFTTYPYFEYDVPGDIPVDYYDEISAHWTGPVIFTEIGWPGVAAFPYPGGLADQEVFVDAFFERSLGLDLEYAMWLFLYDWDQQDTLQAFRDIGLRNNDGSLFRPSDAAWASAVLDRERP